MDEGNAYKLKKINYFKIRNLLAEEYYKNADYYNRVIYHSLTTDPDIDLYNILCFACRILNITKQHLSSELHTFFTLVSFRNNLDSWEKHQLNIYFENHRAINAGIELIKNRESYNEY